MLVLCKRTACLKLVSLRPTDASKVKVQADGFLKEGSEEYRFFTLCHLRCYTPDNQQLTPNNKIVSS